MPASPIRKLVPFALEAKARGLTVHHLNIGQPDVLSPPEALSALKAFASEVIAYSHSQGEAEYLDALLHFYKEQGFDLQQSNINVTVGGSEALVFAFMVTMNPGDEIIIPEPFYTNYNAFAKVAGVKISPITTYGHNGFHLPPREEIEARITERTRAILLCNPNNPTGTVYTNAELEMVADIVEQNNLFLISDEVYREFAFRPEPNRIHSALKLDSIRDRVLVVDSVSKRFSMCGARIGCLISRNEQVMEAVLKLAQARLSSPQVEQVMAMEAHRHYSAYIDDVMDEYKKRRDIVYNGLLAMEGVEVTEPEGAFYIIPRFPISDSEHFARWLLTDFSDNGETVMVAPAPGFYASEGLGGNEIRIAYVLDQERLQRSMELLDKALSVYPQSLR
jgi:aspartate aminotransferase